ncbi:MAG: glutamine amidotransferase [Glaciecola sp.]|jgi:glutamine amidotransferase
MCRMAGYQGPAAPLSHLLYDSDRALSTQAWDPREMLYGNVNVDGTGVAWWPEAEHDSAPLRYATPAAAWNDANLPELAARLRACTMIAAVRSGTAGIPFGPVNVAPFVRGNIALTHNGFIQGFRAGVGRTLLERLSQEAFGEFDAVSDSQVILLLLRTHMATGLDLEASVRAALDDVVAVVTEAGTGATLNLLVSDGQSLIATRSSLGLEQNSLYLSRDTDDSTVIASEPLDSVRHWQKVEAQSIITVRDAEVRIQQLS